MKVTKVKFSAPSQQCALLVGVGLLAGLLGSSVAIAQGYEQGPYQAWMSSDDDTVKVSDSYNREKHITKTVSEDNDTFLRKTHTQDNDYTDSSRYTHTEDNDVTKSWQKSEDNDVDVDFQVVTPTLTSNKKQYQDAGHEASNKVTGIADGHDVYTKGGNTQVSAGNDDTRFYGPAMVNTNVNQVPVNHVFVGGSNAAPIGLSNVMAGRDMGDKGVFAPVGNTSSGVSGDVSNSSGAGVDQRGSASNRTLDSMGVSTRR